MGQVTPWGSETPIRAQISPVRSADRGSLLYLLARTLVARIIGTSKHGHDDSAKDLEILVLRHQLRVPRRTAGRPKLRPIDRVLLAAASRTIPRDRWVTFLVTPATLLRWHRGSCGGHMPGDLVGRRPLEALQGAEGSPTARRPVDSFGRASWRAILPRLQCDPGA